MFRFPRTKRGWFNLIWLTLRRCPFCHGPLSQDWPIYDDGHLWCLTCGGARYPNGFFRSLRENYTKGNKNV